MKTFIVLCAFLAISSAYPAQNSYTKQVQTGEEFSHEAAPSNNYEHQQQINKHIPIVKYESERDDDSFRYGYESENGIAAAEEGYLKSVGEKKAAIVVQGYYSFPAPDGRIYSVKYVADEKGFRAIGDHLPTPPPIPEQIQKALAKIASQPKEEQHYERIYQIEDESSKVEDNSRYYTQEQEDVSNKEE